MRVRHTHRVPPFCDPRREPVCKDPPKAAMAAKRQRRPRLGGEHLLRWLQLCTCQIPPDQASRSDLLLPIVQVPSENTASRIKCAKNTRHQASVFAGRHRFPWTIC